MTQKKRSLVKRRLKPSRTVDLVHVARIKATWADLVLPTAQSKILQKVVTQAKSGATAHGGSSVLFAGADRTGKTLAAQVVANALSRPLHRVDLTAVVSKYIGETEKNLRRLFDSAAASNAILFFDEADALFGKRSDVKDSHDRYANIEVSYLLQRMETFQGLTILTTNLKSSLDQAFIRRLRFVVQFPPPPRTAKRSSRRDGDPIR